MGRLTKWVDFDRTKARCAECEFPIGGGSECARLTEILRSLAEYEDTDLTPNQVRVALNYSGWIDDGYGSYVKVCAHCGGKPLMLRDNLYYSKYCPHCGSIMITGVTYGN